MAGKGDSNAWVIDAAARPKLPVLIIEARYYEAVARELLAGALAELDAQGVAHVRVEVPAALQLPQVPAAQRPTIYLNTSPPTLNQTASLMISAIFVGI